MGIGSTALNVELPNLVPPASDMVAAASRGIIGEMDVCGTFLDKMLHDRVIATL